MTRRRWRPGASRSCGARGRCRSIGGRRVPYCLWPPLHQGPTSKEARMNASEAAHVMSEDTVREFWEARPCGDHIVGGLDERFHHDYAQFFDEYDGWRYDQERHILACLDAVDWR